MSGAAAAYIILTNNNPYTSQDLLIDVIGIIIFLLLVLCAGIMYKKNIYEEEKYKMCNEITNVIKEHIFETLDVMKTNIAKDLNISEDQITFKQGQDKTTICIIKDGNEICVNVDSRILVE